MRRLPTAALIGIVLAAVGVQLWYAFFGGKDILLPEVAGPPGESMGVWPPPGLITLTLADIPVTGLPFLLALPLCTLVALACLRDDSRRGAALALIIGWGFGLTFFVLQMQFVKQAPFGFDTGVMNANVSFLMGRLSFGVALGLVFQTIALVLLWLGRKGRMFRIILGLSGVYWAVLGVAWLTFLYQLAR
jgi:cytochrome c oxidase subunit III